MSFKDIVVKVKATRVPNVCLYCEKVDPDGAVYIAAHYVCCPDCREKRKTEAVR